MAEVSAMGCPAESTLPSSRQLTPSWQQPHCPRSPTALVAEAIAVTRPIRREPSEADAIVAEATGFAVDAALAAEANAFAAEASAANSLVVEAMLPSWRKCDRMWPAQCDRMWPALGP